MNGSGRTPSRAGTVPWPPDAAARYTAAGYWSGVPLGRALYAGADLDPGATCLVDGRTRLSFAEFTARADGLALRLRELGLRADDRVVVQLPNCWEHVVVMAACLRLGVLPVMALTAHRHRELASVAAVAEAAALLVPGALKDFDHRPLAARVAAETPSVRQVLVLGEPGEGAIDLRALCEPWPDPAAARAELDAAEPPAGAVALFMLSSGTTGLPKLIPRTHDDLGYMIRRAAELCGVGPGTVYLAALPLGHGFPVTGPGVLGVLMSGGCVVTVASPAPERAFPVIAEERVTFTSLVPAIVQRWLEHRAEKPGDDLGSLRVLQSGGSRLPEAVARRVEPELGCAVQQVYGMSEGLLCFTRPGDPDEVRYRTQGRPICPDDELLLVDEDGAPVPPGEPGILLTRGPYTTRGYYRGGELNTANFLPGGWYRTGDVVRLLPDGNLVVEGRDKDVINRGGEKIPAEEVEEFALRVPGVERAAAVAMPDPELGERICLYVVPAPGAAVRLEDIRDLMHESGVARFKLPEHLVLVSELPVGGIGKVDKKALRADLAARSAAPAGPAQTMI